MTTLAFPPSFGGDCPSLVQTRSLAVLLSVALTDEAPAPVTAFRTSAQVETRDKTLM